MVCWSIRNCCVLPLFELYVLWFSLSLTPHSPSLCLFNLLYVHMCLIWSILCPYQVPHNKYIPIPNSNRTHPFPYCTAIVVTSTVCYFALSTVFHQHTNPLEIVVLSLHCFDNDSTQWFFLMQYSNFNSDSYTLTHSLIRRTVDLLQRFSSLVRPGYSLDFSTKMSGMRGAAIGEWMWYVRFAEANALIYARNE